MNTILSFDEWLFNIINQDLHNSFLDAIMPVWRDKKTWIPLYVGLLIFLIYRFQWKGLVLAAFVGLTVGAADFTSSKLIKESVQRLRPCNDPDLQEQVELLVRCGSGYSFTSSHATNHFAIAMFIVFTLGIVYPKIKWPFILWAASIALGQVYVGVHYPIDIFVGAIIGSLIGWLISRLYFSFSHLSIKTEKKTLSE